LADDPNQIANSILSRLADAWKMADGAAWGNEFLDDADFVNIFGAQMKGRSDIEKRHQYLFDVLFAGSTCDFAVGNARLLAPNIILVHSTAIAKIPTGPMAGEQTSRQSMVIMRDAGSWRIAAFHNTQVVQQL
jgi:uncharacterized protein (TIGR02246 family)